MRVTNYCRLITIALFAALAITSQLTAQDSSNNKPKHHQYKLYDFGTFGGPQSWPTYFDAAITAAGAASTSDTSAADPFNPYCFIDCFVTHAAFWRQGKVTDLGALPGNSGLNSSFANAMSNNGIVVGSSENGAVDPATGYPEVRAVIWQDGRIVDLGHVWRYGKCWPNGQQPGTGGRRSVEHGARSILFRYLVWRNNSIPSILVGRRCHARPGYAGRTGCTGLLDHRQREDHR